MARYNTSLATNSISGSTNISSPYSGAFTALSGTAPYTVTLPSPVLYPGSNQTFYNTTTGTITLSTPSGSFTGTGGTNSSTVSVYAGNVVSVTSDGTNYVVISEDGSALIATTGNFSGNVDISGTLTVTPTGGINFAPSTTGTINNVAIGGTTRASGNFTTLAANNQVTFTANISSTTTATGTLVVTGGLGVSGTINAANVNANLTGTIQTAAQPNITSVGTLSSLSVSGSSFSYAETNSSSNIRIGPMLNTYPYLRLDSYISDNSGYFWGFGQKTAAGATRINAFFLDNNRGLFSADQLSVTTWTANEYSTSGSNYPAFTTGAKIVASGSSYFNGGSVGVGTSTPVNRLQVVGGNTTIGISDSASGNRARIFWQTTTGSVGVGLFNDDNSNLMFGTTGAERVRIDLNGLVNINAGNLTVTNLGSRAQPKLWVQGAVSVMSNSTNGSTYPDYSATALMLGPSSTRSGTMGLYYGGIGFDHLLNYTTQGNMQYNNDPHIWIGGKTYDTPGYERSSFVVATREGTSGTEKTIERFSIDPFGRVLTPYQPAFQAYGIAGGTWATGSYMIFPSTYVNRGGHYNTSNGRFTAPVSGVYYFAWSHIGSNANDVFRYYFRKNGGNVGDWHLRLDTSATGSEYEFGTRNIIIQLSAGDYVQIYFASDASNASYPGGDSSGNTYPTFGGYLIG